MDKTLIDYDKNLEELEKQREKLQKVMQMMGQEWEESGAGIGWLGQVDLPITSTSVMTDEDTTIVKETPLSQVTQSIQPSISPLSISNQPLFTNILNSNTGPSPEYLQSLLNVNEALLAQSLASPIPESTTTPMLTPTDDDHLYSANDISPLITPNDTQQQQKQKQHQHQQSCIDTESELTSFTTSLQ